MGSTHRSPSVFGSCAWHDPKTPQGSPHRVLQDIFQGQQPGQGKETAKKQISLCH